MTEKLDLEAIEARHNEEAKGCITPHTAVHRDRAALIAEVRRLRAAIDAYVMVSEGLPADSRTQDEWEGLADLSPAYAAHVAALSGQEKKG